MFLLDVSIFCWGAAKTCFFSFCPFFVERGAAKKTSFLAAIPKVGTCMIAHHPGTCGLVGLDMQTTTVSKKAVSRVHSDIILQTGRIAFLFMLPTGSNPGNLSVSA